MAHAWWSAARPFEIEEEEDPMVALLVTIGLCLLMEASGRRDLHLNPVPGALQRVCTAVNAITGHRYAPGNPTHPVSPEARIDAKSRFVIQLVY